MHTEMGGAMNNEQKQKLEQELERKLESAYEYGQRRGRQEIIDAMRALLQIEVCQHCAHTEREHE